jgi:hypothetical protein
MCRWSKSPRRKWTKSRYKKIPRLFIIPDDPSNIHLKPSQPPITTGTLPFAINTHIWISIHTLSYRLLDSPDPSRDIQKHALLIPSQRIRGVILIQHHRLPSFPTTNFIIPLHQSPQKELPQLIVNLTIRMKQPLGNIPHRRRRTKVLETMIPQGK